MVDHLDGTTRIMIPHSAFPQSGLWRLQTTVKLSDNQQIRDDVSFTLSGMLKPTGKTGGDEIGSEAHSSRYDARQADRHSKITAAAGKARREEPGCPLKEPL